VNSIQNTTEGNQASQLRLFVAHQNHVGVDVAAQHGELAAIERPAKIIDQFGVEVGQLPSAISIANCIRTSASNGLPEIRCFSVTPSRNSMAMNASPCWSSIS
jgi:hypothetical protein